MQGKTLLPEQLTNDTTRGNAVTQIFSSTERNQERKVEN